MNELSVSLSAADVHAVTMGDEVVGIVHPSKIYGAFAVERPILFIGPAESHIGDLLSQYSVGWAARHGDVAGVVSIIREIVNAPRAVIEQAGQRAKASTEASLGTARLRGHFCDILASA